MNYVDKGKEILFIFPQTKNPVEFTIQFLIFFGSPVLCKGFCDFLRINFIIVNSDSHTYTQTPLTYI